MTRKKQSCEADNREREKGTSLPMKKARHIPPSSGLRENLEISENFSMRSGALDHRLFPIRNH